MVAIVAGLSMGAYQPPPTDPAFSWPLLAWPVGAALVIGGVDSAAALRQALSGRIFLWLGRHSFGLYLLHFLVASSVASWALLGSRSLPVTLLAYAGGTVLLAMAFTRFVDQPSQRLLARFGSAPIPRALARGQ
jgi:peptidoglycan/LPS O-acetylase OafA/YrhL